jgi:hypothetical protein
MYVNRTASRQPAGHSRWRPHRSILEGVVRSGRLAASIRPALPFTLLDDEVGMYEMGLGSAEAEMSPAEKASRRRGSTSLVLTVMGLLLALVHRNTGAAFLLAAIAFGVAGVWASIKAQRLHRGNPELWSKPTRRTWIAGAGLSGLTVVVVALVSILAFFDTSRRTHDAAVEQQVKDCVFSLSTYPFDAKRSPTEAELRAFAQAELARLDARQAGRRAAGHTITFATGKSQDEGERMARARASSLHAIELVIQLPATAANTPNAGGWSAGAVRRSGDVYVTSLPFWSAH